MLAGRRAGSLLAVNPAIAQQERGGAFDGAICFPGEPSVHQFLEEGDGLRFGEFTIFPVENTQKQEVLPGGVGWRGAGMGTWWRHERRSRRLSHRLGISGGCSLLEASLHYPFLGVGRGFLTVEIGGMLDELLGT